MRTLQRLFIISFLVFSGSFYALYAFRADVYATTEITPATLGELYPQSQDAIAITGLHPRPHAVQLIFNGLEGCDRWHVRVDHADANTLQGASPVLPLGFGPHDYELTPLNCRTQDKSPQTIGLNFYFAPKETFGAQNVSIDQIQLNSSTIPVWMETPQSLSRWVPDVSARAIQETQSARQVLLDAGFHQDWSTREKIAFIATYIRDQMPGGTPAERLNTLTPFHLFREARAGRAKSFCRQWSLTYGFFANAVDIPTRNVFTGGAMGQVDLGSHAFSESYVAEESVWALVDPTDEIAYIQSPQGRLMSGADLYMAAINDNTRNLTARVTGSKRQFVPFPTVSKDLLSFLSRESFLIYIGAYDGRYQLDAKGLKRYPEKIWRFIAQPQQYFGYTPFTSYHWLRPLSFFGAVLSGLSIVLVVLVRWRTRRTRKPMI